MNTALPVVAPLLTRCKCCGNSSPLFGVVDFHKNCLIVRNQHVLELSGMPVYYHRCPRCGFIFTTAFDHYSAQDFRQHIYNDEYALVDPDYEYQRPKDQADFIAQIIPQARSARIMDYGGGNGVTARLLREAGFSSIEVYDPFVEQHASAPVGRFQCIICFEVVEHSPDPQKTFAELNSFLDEEGMIIFSTSLQPADILQQGVGWWYCAPRNGHVSLYTAAAIHELARPLGLRYGSFDQGRHLMARRVPAFARHLISA